jgi:hypothetical protein
VLAIASLTPLALVLPCRFMSTPRVVSEKDEQHNATKSRNWHSQLEHRMWRHSDRLHYPTVLIAFQDLVLLANCIYVSCDGLW